MENTDLTCCSSTRVGIVGDDSWESERSEIQTKPGVVVLSQELSMNLGYSVDGFGSLNGAVGGWIPKQNDGKVIRLVKTLSKIAVRQGFNLFYIGTNSVQITSAYKEPRHLATLKSVRLIWQSLFNVAFREDDGRNKYLYVLNLQLQEGMDTRKDGSVRTRNSIKWSTPNVEEHGEKNIRTYPSLHVGACITKINKTVNDTINTIKVCHLYLK